MVTEAPVRVVVADDTPEIRLLLRAALRRAPDLELVGEASDGAQAVSIVAQTRPDVIVLDLAMPVMDGLQAIPEILRASPGTRILVLTGFDRVGLREDAERAGAHGLIEKGRPLEEMLGAVRAVCGRSAPPRDVEPAPEPPAEDAALGDVLAVLGHELSSPVAVIAGFAAILSREAPNLSPDAVAEYAAAIERSGKQLQDLIATLQDLRHLDAGALPVERSRTAILPLVRATVEELSDTLAPHPVVASGLLDAVIEIDAARIRQALREVLVNAARYSPPSTPIEVTMEATDAAVTIAVRDRCDGIPAESRQTLFRPFGKGRAGGPGLGVGLAIARAIARAHDGDLVLETPADGGCRFVLRLPR